MRWQHLKLVPCIGWGCDGWVYCSPLLTQILRGWWLSLLLSITNLDSQQILSQVTSHMISSHVSHPNCVPFVPCARSNDESRVSWTQQWSQWTVIYTDSLHSIAKIRITQRNNLESKTITKHFTVLCLRFRKNMCRLKWPFISAVIIVNALKY